MMQPPGRIEQLNNFQDSIQSPDGLDRLRALQYIEQALPSSQGLSGMPQVTVPTPQMQPQVPMMNRAYGGEIGTGGLVNVLEDGTQVFDNSQEGALNRATHGGVLEGFNYTPSTGGTATATPATATAREVTTNSLDAPGTLAAGGDTGASTGLRPPTSNYDYLDIPDTLYPESRGAQTTQRMPDGTIPYDLYVPKMPVTFGQGFDLKDVPYLTANRMAQDAGADRFIYNDEYAGTAALPDDYDVGVLGTQVYRDDQLDKVNYTGTQMGQGPGSVTLAPNPNSEFAMRAKGYTRNPYTQQLEYSPSNTLNARVAAARLVPTQAGVQMQYKHGGQITARAYGGEIGTGGLVDILDDGTQVFNNSQEGALNRATHGGVLEGYNFTPSTGGTATAGVTTNSLDAPGTLASGITAPSGFTIEDGMVDQYGNTIGDFSGTKDYYDLNYAARDAGQDTFMYGDKLMQVDPGYLQGGGLNPFISNRLPEDVITNPHLYTSTGETGHNLNTLQKRPDVTKPGFFTEAPYLPTADFNQDISGQYNSYYEANQAAKEAGSPTFMYGSKLAKTDPGLLPDYRGDPKPFISNAVPEKYITAGVNLPPGFRNMSAQQLARAQTGNFINNAGMYGANKHGGPVIKREGGGQIDPSQAAQGLASFGRYGDNILVHMNPEELNGLASLGQITYNPVTGLPEAFSFKSIFKAVRKLAPIALAIAAPYAFGATTALGIGASTALGSFAGNIIAGAKPKDALKAGLFSGLTAGFGSYLGGASSGFGSAAGQAGSQAAGQAIGQTVGPGAMGAGGFGTAATQGTSLLGSGLSTMPTSMGAGGFGQAIGAGGTVAAPVASQFTNVVNASNQPSYGGAARQQLQLAPKVNSPSQVYGGPKDVGNPMAMENINPVSEFTPQQITYAPGQFGQTNLPETNQIQGPPEYVKSTSIFEEGGLSKENLGKMGNEIYDKYSTTGGIAKLVGMDLMTPDYEAQYAAEAAAKNQQLTDAGYTVETGFDGQTVIRDSTGVVMPRNLTVQDILDRALGKQKRTNLVARTDYAPKESKQGGLISLKHGGEFSGMVPGDGHGMEDNVYMPIVEKGHGSQVGTLAVSPSEYVVDSYTMAALGNGNADAGAKVMDNVVKRVRKKAYGDTKQPNEISGLSALEPMIERV